ncbi:ferredoxin, 2Fe-2S [Novosphingobium sp. CF614]|uniref:2Fe-2S iron-sulfur cluster-binding protein n=1 Tax=Novosphingobium sp. CF614 TaxID=1884364 RepID=UPI0008DF91E2|nr:2Fe-2S iron-sulfur cluster-binding protein [Novosphingobium sp. CF614]SFF82977.1 ferredoxin, 2Fe-2S [Novosphingobium sp. CF614]
MKITYIESDGTPHTVDATIGWSIMENAVKNGVPGILAECGGSATCGTCRIYVEADWQGKMSPPHPDETTLLEYVEEERPDARLSCQVSMTESLNGLVVRMPERQYS